MRRVGASYERCGNAKMQGIWFEKQTDHNKSLWGAFVGASLVALLPNLLSNRLLFEVISAAGFALALFAGIRGLLRKTLGPFQAIAPIVATGMLVFGGLLVSNTEDWR